MLAVGHGSGLGKARRWIEKTVTLERGVRVAVSGMKGAVLLCRPTFQRRRAAAPGSIL